LKNYDANVLIFAKSLGYFPLISQIFADCTYLIGA